MSKHYGPWRITVTDGDTAIQHEIYALSEEDAIKEWRLNSDFAIDESNENAENDDVTVSARRLP